MQHRPPSVLRLPSSVLRPLSSVLRPPSSAPSLLAGLRICFLAGTLGQGGAERQLYYILKTLKAQGAELQLLCLTQNEYWEQPIRDLGIPVSWVGQTKNPFARLARISREVRAFKPDIVQSQHFYTNTYAALSARAAHCQDIGAIRSDGFNELRSNGRIFGNLHLRLPSLLAANSQAAIRNLLGLGVPERKLAFLPNVVDTDHFAPRPFPRAQSDPFTILGVGRLGPEKRFDRFLEIVAAVRQQVGDGVQGVIAGDGPLKAELKKHAANLKLGSGALEFVGAVSDVRSYYHRADLLLLTSDYEGTPNVILEAMSCGIPVVSTAVGEIASIFESPEQGCLFAPEDPTTAIRQVCEIFDSSLLWNNLSDNARKRVVDQFSCWRLPAHFLSLYADK